jgi:hypothetical protein
MFRKRLRVHGSPTHMIFGQWARSEWAGLYYGSMLPWLIGEIIAIELG